MAPVICSTVHAAQNGTKDFRTTFPIMAQHPPLGATKQVFLSSQQ